MQDPELTFPADDITATIPMPTMTRGPMPTSGRLVTIPSANRTAHVCRPLAVLTVNDAAVRQYGYSRAEFLAMTLDDIHPSDQRLTA